MFDSTVVDNHRQPRGLLRRVAAPWMNESLTDLGVLTEDDKLGGRVVKQGGVHVSH